MAQDRIPTPPKLTSTLPQWRWLIAPMLLVSLGLHGLVLFIPTGPAEEELLPPPDPEEDGVAVIKIDAPSERPTAANTDPGTVKTARPSSATPRPTATAPAGRAAPRQQNPQSGNRRPSDRPSPNPNNVGSPELIGDLPNADQATEPNPQPSPTDGRATSDIGRRPPDRPGDATAAEADPFGDYIEIFKTYSGLQLTEGQAAERRELWLQSLRDRGPTFADLEIRPLKIFEPLPYAANICLPAPPDAARILVLVDGDGTLDSYQPFVQQTQYRAFDNAAEDRVRQYAYPEVAEPRAYRVELAVDYDDTDCDWPPDVDRLPDGYFTVLASYVGPAVTTPRAADATKAAWLQTLRESAAIDLPEDDDLEIPKWAGFIPDVSYPLGICLPVDPKEQVEVGVLVQPDGTLGSDPVTLRSTGYQYFDDRARELVKTVAFTPSDAPQIWVIEVPIAYDADDCQSLESDTFDRPPDSTLDRSNPDARPPSDPGSDVAIAFNPPQQTTLLETGRQRVAASPVGSLNQQLALAAASLESGWPVDIEQSCFLADLTTETFRPVETAADALILSEAADQVPSTLSRLYTTEAADAGEYCGAPLIQMSLNGAVQLLASVIPLRNEAASTLVVFWTADPRD
ncbi:energy transducer TonB [Halomicronema sp. CCY15110]|uniref:energy transducer TonB family protein n=1 Tax=Halomicronema sp. CCY15110 TaxID=2767773 RepID=UPI00194DD4BA|nr:energy transducer TonB [Halomicronema sp. CCY15110]